MRAGGATGPVVKLIANRASWTLLDQSIVSLGSFLINVQLARERPKQKGKCVLFGQH